MANFTAMITDVGSEVMTRLLAAGEMLQLVRAEAGSGRPAGEAGVMTALQQPEELAVDLQEQQYVESEPPYLNIPVQITNAGLAEAVWVREIGIWAQDEQGEEFLFCYAWLSGADSDNVLPATAFDDGSADTLHIHDLPVLVTNQQGALITVQVGAGSTITYSELKSYAAPLIHEHTAGEIFATNGENLEEVKHRQDTVLQTLQEQIEAQSPVKQFVVSGTLPISGWTGSNPHTLVQVAEGITSDVDKCHVVVTPAPNLTSAQRTAWINADVSCIAQGTESLTFAAYNAAPTVALPWVGLVFLTE